MAEKKSVKIVSAVKTSKTAPVKRTAETKSKAGKPTPSSRVKSHMSLAEVRAAAAAKTAAATIGGHKTRIRKTAAERMAAPVRKQAAKVKTKPTIGKKIAAKMDEAKARRSVAAQTAPEPFIKPSEKKTVRFSSADLEDFRKELMYMRRRIAAKIKSDNRASFKREDESHRNEESTEAYDRFFAIETSESYQEIIYHIDEALKSIKEGTYGICKNCGGLIQKPRLQALPFAKNCIRCQSLSEKTK